MFRAEQRLQLAVDSPLYLPSWRAWERATCHNLCSPAAFLDPSGPHGVPLMREDLGLTAAAASHRG